jgi:hypothetical protein
MINRFLISAATVALIAGAPAAYAQGNNREGGGAAMQQNAPTGNAGGGATEKNAPGGMKSTQSEQKAPGAAKGQRAEESTPGQKSKGMSSENETKGAAGNMKSEGHDKNMKAEGREGQDKNMQDKNMKAEGRNASPNANVTTGQAGAGAKLSSEQRTKITTVIRNEHVAPVTNIDFSVSVGTKVPRERVSLRALPSEVVTIYPEWRGYEFFLVRDEIVVVDPRTLEIVAVLPA